MRGAGLLAILPWVLNSRGSTRAHRVPERTVYNPRTRQHEQMTVAELQQLATEGKITSIVCGHCGHTQFLMRRWI